MRVERAMTDDGKIVTSGAFQAALAALKRQGRKVIKTMLRE